MLRALRCGAEAPEEPLRARPVLRSGYALIHDDAVIGNPSMLIG
jgi:hypothetical protein